MNLPSPHPGSFLKAPMPLPMGEGGRRPGEGSVADRTALLGGPRLLATTSLSDGWFTQLLFFDLLFQQNHSICRHIRFQLMFGIGNVNLDPVDEFHPFLRGLNLFRGKLGFGCDEG